MEFRNIAGYDAVKEEITRIIGWYLNQNHDSSLRLPRGILLIGYPGVGKTQFLRAIKEEHRCRSIFLNCRMRTVSSRIRTRPSEKRQESRTAQSC